MRNPHPNGCQTSKLVCRHRPIALFTSSLLQGLPGVELRIVRGKSEGWWLWAHSPTYAALNLRRRVTHPEQLFLNTQVRSGLIPITLLNQEQIGIYRDAVILEAPIPQLPTVYTPPAPPAKTDPCGDLCKEGGSHGGKLQSLSSSC